MEKKNQHHRVIMNVAEVFSYSIYQAAPPASLYLSPFMEQLAEM